MGMSVVPLELPPKSRVLIAGAGGGFDVICGLPIAIALEAAGHHVDFANYSFTDLRNVVNGHWHNERLLEITSESYLKVGDYFPERLLALWYKEKRKSDRSIYCFAHGGVQPTLASYSYLVEQLNIDTVICVDGGIDGLFRGDECDLGTPSMDSISIVSAALCNVDRKFYCITAFGIEGAEGNVSHGLALRRMAELVKEGAFFGVGSIIKETPVGQDFLSAVNYIYNYLPSHRRSVIVSSIVAAMQGTFGRTVVHPKTENSPPWLSPLTQLLWYFDAVKVAQLKLFYQDILESVEVAEVAEAIEKVRSQYGVKEFEKIPI